MAFSRFLLTAALCLGLAAPAAAKMNFRQEKTDSGVRYIVIEGEFAPDDKADGLKKAVEQYKPDLVMFNSPGGNVASAMEYGRLIRELGLPTLQVKNHECASACSLAFLGGVQRYAEPGSIGVHRASFTDEVEAKEAVAAIQELTAEVIGYLTEMEVDPALLQISLAVDNSDIRYLTAAEMLDLGVTTGDWSELDEVK